MPQRAWSKQQRRQYDHIKTGLLERGQDEDTAEEIAARTVNKERARAGGSRSPAEPRPRTSPRAGAGGCARTVAPVAVPRDQLYREAREKSIKGRSRMNKAELERAVGR